MPQVTDIKPQKRKQRFNVYLDGKFAFGLSAESLVKEGLKIDQEISEEKIQELIKQDDFIRVYDRVLKFFSYRPRSEKELQDWFKRKEIGEETQKLITQKLENLGYLNDEEFAKWWIEQRKAFHPGGKRLLKLELYKKGIAKELIEEVLDESDSIDELKMAKKIVEKKLKTLKDLPKNEQKQKLIGALSRRGFSWETINEVCKLCL